MTMTEVRRPASADGWEQAPRREPQRSTQPGLDPAVSNELIATCGLLLFTIAIAAGYARVFSGWDFFDDFLALAVVGHGFGFLSRRLRIPGLLAVPLLAALLVWMIGFVHYRDTYSMLLPTGDTLDLLRSEIELVRENFQRTVAPVNYGGGWDILAAIGMGLTILLSDTFAFRAFARAEALVPGGVLFVFVAALGSDRDRIALSGALVAAGVAATVALRAHHGPERQAAIGHRRSPSRVILPAALGTAAIVAVVASFVGPRLPGADSAPIYETRGGSGGSVTNVISPLVDIRSRLTNNSTAELFTVRADFASYWRLSALPRFNGTEWGLPERSLSRVDGRLNEARKGADVLRQEIAITDLGAQFVPAAADPTAASPQDGLRFNPDTATLLKIDGDLVPGDAFIIESASPRFAVADLQSATSTDAGDPIYLALPDGFPSSVGDTARAVTSGASTPYEIALTLQNWFRSEFQYSLEVQEGHSNNAIEAFLRDRIGYCEQFSGTYAAMMRSLGIPARVAVGFTPGIFDGEQYSVLGKNAHAWPEVWFDGLGWVPFEPTPGRGAPGNENYTNVPAQQDAAPVEPAIGDGDATDQSLIDQEVVPQTTVAPVVTGPDGQPVILDSIGDEQLPTPIPTGTTPTPSDTSVPWRTLAALSVAALAIALPEMIRRWRRRHGPSDAAGTVAMLWQRSLTDVGDVGVRPKASSTPTEHADAVAAQFPVISRPFHSLAHAMTEVSYSPIGGERFDTKMTTGGTHLDECRQWSRQIERAVGDSVSPVVKVRRYFTRLT